MLEAKNSRKRIPARSPQAATSAPKRRGRGRLAHHDVVFAESDRLKIAKAPQRSQRGSSSASWPHHQKKNSRIMVRRRAWSKFFQIF